MSPQFSEREDCQGIYDLRYTIYEWAKGHGWLLDARRLGWQTRNGAACCVVNRGGSCREPICKDDKDRELFLEILERELQTRRKGDKNEAATAARLRKETTMNIRKV